jgi:DNA-binding LacI/PurR family transcriptional regulator
MSNKRLTMADIGRLAGVSASTVSRALNQDPAIAEETRTRIHQLAAQHNYIVNERARNFRLQRTQTIATVFPYTGASRRAISDPFYMELLGAIADELDANSYDLVIARVAADDPRWYERFVQVRRVDGLLLVDRLATDANLARLAALDMPLVVWGAAIPDQAVLSVGGDSQSGAALAVHHLVERGRRRIGFVGGYQDMVETAERYRGYQAELVEAGLAFDPALAVFTDFSPRAGSRAVLDLLARAPDLDGLFVCSDFMAIAALELLRAQGRDVPRDIAVVGYDDIQLAAHSSPRLTTIHQPIDQGGRLLVRTLLDAVRGKAPTAITLPLELVVRDSS